MKIAIIGAGAMGSIYGGHLSVKHEVYLIDKHEALIKAVHEKGLKLNEAGKDNLYYPKAVTCSEGIGEADLILLFVKALFSRSALEENKSIIGDNTYIMTLQNGSGHEDILSSYVPLNRVIIGTTEDNGAVLEPGYIRRGGEGKTNIGMVTEDKYSILSTIKNAFDSCGFQVKIHDNIQQLIWDKLFTNVSLSAVTGILQVPMGYIAQNPFAWEMTKQLVQEAVTVAKAMNLDFDMEVILKRIHETSVKSPEGLTSIYMDIHNGRNTEVDTISGSVVKAAKKLGIPVPTHSFVVNMVHALEQK